MMKRLATLLVTIIISAVYYNCGYAASLEKQGYNISPTIEEETADYIGIISDRLKECSLELPQQTDFHSTTKGEQSQSRRIAGNGKYHLVSPALPEQQRFIATDISGKKAVTSSRHSRGYYIYALRHIII